MDWYARRKSLIGNRLYDPSFPQTGAYTFRPGEYKETDFQQPQDLLPNGFRTGSPIIIGRISIPKLNSLLSQTGAPLVPESVCPGQDLVIINHKGENNILACPFINDDSKENSGINCFNAFFDAKVHKYQGRGDVIRAQAWDKLRNGVILNAMAQDGSVLPMAFRIDPEYQAGIQMAKRACAYKMGLY